MTLIEDAPGAWRPSPDPPHWLLPVRVDAEDEG